MRCPAEGVDAVAERQGIRIDDVEGATVHALEVRDVVDGRGNEVDGYQVERTTLGADERRPLGEGIAHLLDELEGVIGTVDAIGLTRLR